MALQIVSLIGIVIAVAFQCWAVYKGLGLPMATLISCVIVWVSGGADIQAGYSAAAEVFTGTIGTMLPLFMFGTILGWIYVESGAIASLGRAFFGPVKKIQNPTARRIGLLFAFFIIRFIIGLSGIDNMAIMVFMVALVTVLFREMDAPRKYANCCLMVAGTISTFMPSVPTMLNEIVPMFLPGYTANTQAGVRWIFCIVFVVGSVIWLNSMIAKDMAKGERFIAAKGMDVGDLDDDTIKRPHWILTLLPVVLIYVLYNFCGFEGWTSLATGTILACLMFYRYLRAPEGRKLFGYFIEQTNSAAVRIPLHYMIGYALATSITTSVGWELLNVWMNNLATAINPAVGFGIVSFILVPIGASAMMINCTLAAEVFVPAGLSLASAGTLLIVAQTVLDTLPNSPGMIMQAELTETPMKVCYPPIFKTTVLLTGGIYIVNIVLAAVGII